MVIRVRNEQPARCFIRENLSRKPEIRVFHFRERGFITERRTVDLSFELRDQATDGFVEQLVMAFTGDLADEIAGEFGDVLLGKVPGRRREDETVVFESVGMSLWDSTAAGWVYRWAQEKKIGTAFSLE